MDTPWQTLALLLSVMMTANVMECFQHSMVCLKPGVLIGPLTKTSLDDCETKCKNDPNCTYYIYLNTTGQCGTRWSYKMFCLLFLTEKCKGATFLKKMKNILKPPHSCFEIIGQTSKMANV